jgi:hypothetical protein
MSQPDSSKTDHRFLSYGRIYSIAGIWGILIGCLTFAAGPITALSGNSLIAAAQMGLVNLLLPGLFASAVTGYFGPGALINALLHFILCLVVLLLLRKIIRRSQRVRD